MKLLQAHRHKMVVIICYVRKLLEPVPDSYNTHLTDILVYEILD
jgi:hypothetical protein